MRPPEQVSGGFLFCTMQYSTTEEIYKVFQEAAQQVSTDTRKLEKGSVFFALKGSNFDGNAFCRQALDSGCSAVVADDSTLGGQAGVLLVEDVLKALQDLARHHRRQFNIPVLAITGSNGKTTNKELIREVLSKKYKVLATTGNLNNHIGVPLTLLSLTSEHEFAVIEMGANHQGEIRQLCAIAEPSYGLITNIGKAHLEGFGGEEGVRKGKGELFDFLRQQGGRAIINGDDPVLSEMAFTNDKITFGCKKLYDLIGKDEPQAETVAFRFTTRYGEKDFKKLPLVKTSIFGQYNLYNCLAAACIGVYFKVPEADIIMALESYVPDMNRSQVKKTEKNTLILDAYNANPDSMKAALQNFSRYPATTKWILLGDMFELGEFAEQEHQAILDLARALQFENVLMVGTEFAKLKGAPYLQFKTTAEALAYLSSKNLQSAVILIKGSRSMQMETLQQAL